jgi:hypothetical protein
MKEDIQDYYQLALNVGICSSITNCQLCYEPIFLFLFGVAHASERIPDNVMSIGDTPIELMMEAVEVMGLPLLS